MSGGEGFWNFSLRVYAAEGVPEACLTLQDRLGADVNLLLYCCWLGQTDRTLDGAGLGRALAVSSPWAQHVVQPLRSARSWMKSQNILRTQVAAADYAALRTAIKAVELRAEQLQQQALESSAGLGSERLPMVDRCLQRMASNLRSYLADANLEIDPQVAACLATILVAASGAEPVTVQETLQALDSAKTEASHD